jgi:hypothetical protein
MAQHAQCMEGMACEGMLGSRRADLGPTEAGGGRSAGSKVGFAEAPTQGGPEISIRELQWECCGHCLQPGRCRPAGHSTLPGQSLHAELRGLVDVLEDFILGFLGPVPGVDRLGLGQGVIREWVRLVLVSGAPGLRRGSVRCATSAAVHLGGAHRRRRRVGAPQNSPGVRAADERCAVAARVEVGTWSLQPPRRRGRPTCSAVVGEKRVPPC